MTEKDILQKMNQMCTESLDPQMFEHWEKIKAHLETYRKGLESPIPNGPVKLILPKGITMKVVRAFIQSNKKYNVPYLTPLQSYTGEFTFGEFQMQGNLLTENQMKGVFLGRWTNELCEFKDYEE